MLPISSSRPSRPANIGSTPMPRTTLASRIFIAAPQVHILFTDVNMPGDLNGIDLAEQLKAAFPALHVIITSALPILRPVDHLPATFVSKPYEPSRVSQDAMALLAA